MESIRIAESKLSRNTVNSTPLSEGKYCCTLMDEIFPPYICAHGPGEDPFEAVMCTVGAASQISFCLLKDLFLIQNITCISTGFYFIKTLFN